jgi:4-amino-4-deoxy-L-arabinose transferase-like glycosyltransferase
MPQTPHHNATEPSASRATGFVSRFVVGPLFPVFLLAVFALSACYSMSRESATFDETAHIWAGYTYLKRSDFRMNVEHPPLIKLLAAAPLVLTGARMPTSDGDDNWTQGRQWVFGYKFFYATPGNDADRLLFMARFPVVLLGMLLGVLVFFFARDLTGPAGARIALFAFALCPTMLAHTRLVTTDLGMGLFYLASVYAVYRAGRRITPLTMILPGVALGLALSTKFSALLLLPVMALLLLVRALDSSPLDVALPFRRTPAATRPAKLAACSILLFVTLVIAWLTVWSSYGFRFSITPDTSAEIEASVSGYINAHRAGHPGFSRLIDRAASRRLLPEGFLGGFTYAAARSGERSAYLLGAHSLSGFRYFFPVAFLVKTPLALLVALIPALALLGRDRRRSWGVLCLAVAGSCYIAAALTSNLNIGHRHLLPVYPFLFVALGALAHWLERTRTLMVLGGLGIWYVAAWLYITPHYLAYFNELTLGPAHGDRVLVDSSIDWGQDVKALGRYAERHGITRLPYAHFGTASPNYYGIKQFIALPGYSLLPPEERSAVWTIDDLRQGKAEYVAIHVTNLRGVYLYEGTDYYKDFWGLEPVARIGYSINVYRNPWFRPSPQQAPDHGDPRPVGVR